MQFILCCRFIALKSGIFTSNGRKTRSKQIDISPYRSFYLNWGSPDSSGATDLAVLVSSLAWGGDFLNKNGVPLHTAFYYHSPTSWYDWNAVNLGTTFIFLRLSKCKLHLIACKVNNNIKSQVVLRVGFKIFRVTFFSFCKIWIRQKIIGTVDQAYSRMFSLNDNGCLSQSKGIHWQTLTHYIVIQDSTVTRYIFFFNRKKYSFLLLLDF